MIEVTINIKAEVKKCSLKYPVLAKSTGGVSSGVLGLFISNYKVIVLKPDSCNKWKAGDVVSADISESCWVVLENNETVTLVQKL